MHRIEWVALDDDTVVIADDTGAFWGADRADMGDDAPFAAPMVGPGSRESTRSLLDGVISLGLGPLPSAGPPRAPTRARYAMDLIGSFHNSGRTVGNYLRAARRFRDTGRDDLAAYLERHAREENGHEKLAVRDLDALGFPGARLVARVMPPGVAPLCRLFDQLSADDHPVGCIGYSYFFESAAARRTGAQLDAWQSLSVSGADVTRFMRAHSSLGSEADHVEDMLDFIAGLPPDDRAAIVRATHLTSMLAGIAARHIGVRSDHVLWAELVEAAAEESTFCLT
jgi:hypothetical protein